MVNFLALQERHIGHTVSGCAHIDDRVVYRVTEKVYLIRYFRSSISVKIGRFLPNIESFKP